MKNWPVILGNSISYMPAVADIDDDGRDEIAVGVKDCRVFLLDDDGRNMPGWPRETAAWIARGPMMEDVDGDGEYEIAAGSIDGFIHMWHEDGSIVSGWPLDLGGSSTSAPILFRSGSSNEVSILVSTVSDVHLLSPRGISRNGWPKALQQMTYAGYFGRRPTWAADLDGDGSPEILHLTSLPAFLYAWYQDGTEYPGYPVAMGDEIGLGLAIDDRADPRYIACTTKKEIVLYDLKDGNVRSLPLLDRDDWIATAPWFISSREEPDQRADLLLTSTVDGYIYMWDLEGRLLPGWPVRLNGFIYGIREEKEKHMSYGPPIMSDVDGDGEQEVILGSYDLHLYCFKLDGSLVPGWPIVLEDFIVQGLALAQLDGEGMKELIVGQFGETMFAYHLDPGSPRKTAGAGRRQDSRIFSEWPPVYYAVLVAIVVLLLLLVHILRSELSGYTEFPGRRLTGILLLILLVIVIRALILTGDLRRYAAARDNLAKAEETVQSVLEEERANVLAKADELVASLDPCSTVDLNDPMKALRCLERLGDHNRLEYHFDGLLLADRSGNVIQGVGLGRGWTHLSELGLSESGAPDPVLVGNTPVYAGESSLAVIAGQDTLRLFLLSSLLNKVPNRIADATGMSAHIRVDGRTLAWGGAGIRPYRSISPWLGVVQPSREVDLTYLPGGPRLSILLAMEDFERPRSQWMDLAVVLLIPFIYLLFAGRKRDKAKAKLNWWWIIAFGAFYVAGTVLLHQGRLNTGPVPAAGRTLEVFLHMVGLTGVVVALHRILTSRRSRRLNFTMLGSYLVVSLIPLSGIMIVGANLFLGVQRKIIEETVSELETRADNMVLSYLGSMQFIREFINSADEHLGRSTEVSWLNFAAETQLLFNYDMPTAYITLWARDREDSTRYFTGYSYRAPRTGKLYYTRPLWMGEDNIKGLFFDNGTAVIRAMRTLRAMDIEAQMVGHIPIDDKILRDIEERLRILKFLPRVHLEPAWLESTTDREWPKGWYIPYNSELVLQARGWNTGTPRWAVYRANFYIPAGGEMLWILVPVILLVLLPLGLSFWGAYTTFKRTARPMTRLLAGIRRVGEGDLKYRLGESGQTEIGLAARSFNAMATSFEEMIGELAAKQKVEEVSRLKSRFISMVSHDLKTPLSSIRGAAENVLEEVAGPVTERQRTYLEMILKSSRDLQRMITDLLDLSRIESGRLVLNIEPLDIRHEAEDLLNSIRPLLEKEGMTGLLIVRTEGTIVRGDRTRVWQIMNNIVSNAVRYSPEGGTIEIMIDDVPTDETDGRRMVLISVRDEGPGISEEGATKLFEPFFYRSSGLTGAHGAGLGLAIVKQLVELHGGEVSIRNATAGGTVFSFTMPGWS
ncbi:MAG: HAMP domain-containing protein [Candidatus Krumholzibacteria bacterium]|nr:HAMP domain-containing protein [Candidatus Krumholzibacteria bacterium]